jgi:hypothetical protein
MIRISKTTIFIEMDRHQHAIQIILEHMWVSPSYLDTYLIRWVLLSFSS